MRPDKSSIHSLLFGVAVFIASVMPSACFAQSVGLARVDVHVIADANRAARRALAYLPKNAYIRAKIYPVIKPRENSFVFEVKTDPAIFLYLDPAVGQKKFENTLAHELHHIG